MALKFNESGFKQRQRMVSERLRLSAERVRDEAERRTEQAGLRRTGQLDGGWYVQESPNHRWGWEVGNPDYKAWFFEKGVRAHGGHPGFPAYRILERASDEWRKR